MVSFDAVSGSPVSGDGDGRPPVYDVYSYEGGGEFYWEGNVEPEFISGIINIFGYEGSGKFSWTGTPLDLVHYTKSHGIAPVRKQSSHAEYIYKGGVLAKNASSFVAETQVEFFTEHVIDDYQEAFSDKRGMSFARTHTPIYFFDQIKYLREEDDALISLYAVSKPKSVQQDDEEVLMLLDHLQI